MRDALPEARHQPRVAATVLVAALGQPACGDDGAGPLALRLLEALGVPGGTRLARIDDPLLLLEMWESGDEVVVLDAARGGGAPGEIRTFDALRAPLPRGVHPVSTHGMGLPEALDLAQTLRRLPWKLTVHAVVGTAFGAGDAMTEPVRRAAERLAGALHGALGGIEPGDSRFDL